MDVRKCLRSCFCDCVCVRWKCWEHWRTWCKPLMIMFYLLVFFIALPLLIYGLYRENAQPRFKVWFVAGIFLLLTLPIFLLGLMQHLFNYTKPHLQKHIIRILWMVPIYSLDSWFGLKFPVTAVYLDTIRECYEAYVLYNFLRYLLNFLEADYDLPAELEAKSPVQQPIPFCCCAPWPKGMTYVRRCKIGVLQYTVVRVVLTVIALITQLCGVYGKGHLSPKSAYLYIGIMNGISQLVALHSLIYFYKGTRTLLKPIHPVGKFLSIKAIVFFTFWQSLLIAILVKVKPISDMWVDQYDSEDVAEAFQNFIICIEMLLFAIAHYFVFSHKPFIDPAAAQAPCIHSCLRMLDVRDVAGDMKEHFVDPIPRPSFQRIKQRFRERSSDSAANGPESESDPLMYASVLYNSSVTIEDGKESPPISSSVAINDGSFSFLSYSDMKVQQRSLLKVIKEEREGTTSSDGVRNDDNKTTSNSTPDSP